MHGIPVKSLVLAGGLAAASSAFALGLPGGGGGQQPPVTTPASCPTELPAMLPVGATEHYRQRPGVAAGNVEVVQIGSGRTAPRVHIYTPPGYSASGSEGYPVLYLSHGGGQDDSNWTSRDERWGGSADIILDNLIAEERISPMVVVMPDTSSCAGLSPVTPGGNGGCQSLFRDTLIPYVEANYNVKADRNNRALAGLSQGGIVAFNVGFGNLDLFSHVFSYGSGWFSSNRRSFEREFSTILQDPATNSKLNTPLYMAAGYDDLAYENTLATLEILDSNRIVNLHQEHEGGHDMDSFRRHLHQTLPLMFVNTEGCGSR